MTDVSLATRHTIVSMAARGRRSMDIADRTALPVAVVRQIAEEYGAPDLGKLAWASGELRRQLDTGATAAPSVTVASTHVNTTAPPPRTPGGITAATGIATLLAEAERIGSPRLVNRAKDLASRLDTLRTDLAAAVKVHAEEAAKDVKRARLAELKAEEAKLRAELRGESKPAAKPKRTRTAAAPKAPSEASVIRTWAKENGVECPDFGRIPQKVQDAYATRGSAA